ncbi:MAG: DUF721 domain-containing protein [Cytophagaceae bacterium]|nr:DUF721 domain-containing protein [Cytophagaceae bacterium]MDW8455716.1 DUF721 domain-containing protein [Cytophagaceae bacterium]
MKSLNSPFNKRRAEVSPLKEAIDEMLKAYKISNKYRETQLIQSWKDIMGQAIANRTNKLYIKKRKLYVELTSAPLRMELSMGKEKLLQVLNKSFDEPVIDDVIFI